MAVLSAAPTRTIALFQLLLCAWIPFRPTLIPLRQKLVFFFSFCYNNHVRRGWIGMLNACATELTDRLLRRFPMAQARKAVYIYGFELTLSSLAVMLSVFILSCLFGAVNTSFTFSLIFVSIRLFSGGYHAKTYGRCFILSNAIYMGCFGAAHLIQLLKVGFLGPFLTLLSMTLFVC